MNINDGWFYGGLNCTNRVAKTKALISFAVTAKLICAFVFVYADCWFFHAAANLVSRICFQGNLRFSNIKMFVCIFRGYPGPASLPVPQQPQPGSVLQPQVAPIQYPPLYGQSLPAQMYVPMQQGPVSMYPMQVSNW